MAEQIGDVGVLLMQGWRAPLMTLGLRRKAAGLLTGLALSLCAPSIGATPLDASSFISLGAFPSLAGTYSIDTSTLSFSGPGGYSATGVDYGGIAVFRREGGKLSLLLAKKTGETFPTGVAGAPNGGVAYTFDEPCGTLRGVLKWESGHVVVKEKSCRDL